MILVLEDDPAIRKGIVRVLERAGYPVLGASEPAEALELAGQQGAALRLLITDFSLHAITGREVAERVRKGAPGLRVLYVSGHVEGDVLPPERRSPGSAFLQKPFSMERLLAEVRTLLQ